MFKTLRFRANNSTNSFESGHSDSSTVVKHEHPLERMQREKIREGATFCVKYLGSILVSELKQGQSYGDYISAEAVKTIVTMAKASKKKLPLIQLHVCPTGIQTTDLATQETVIDLDIYRICFCTADKNCGKVSAIIARNKDNETMECYAFMSKKRKFAQLLTLTVAECFSIAKEDEEKRKLQQQHTWMSSGTSSQTVSDSLSTAAPSSESNVNYKLIDI